jgi:SHS2 domain-containing protein
MENPVPLSRISLDDQGEAANKHSFRQGEILSSRREDYPPWRRQGYCIMKRYQLIDHTADIGFEVRSRTLPGLFAESAYALFDLAYRLKAVGNEICVPVTVHSDSLESLMVQWLNELIFLLETGSCLFRRAEVSLQKGFSLEARLYGQAKDAVKYTPYRSIKAATYHHLVVEKNSSGQWISRVILDV